MSETTLTVGVYTHALPDGTVFYVGKGTQARSRLIKSAKRSAAHSSFVAQCGKRSVKIHWALSENESAAFREEKQLIAHCRLMGFPLVNKTDGGEGPSGHKHSSETREKIRKAQRAKWADQEHRILAVQGMRAYWDTQEAREAASKRIRSYTPRGAAMAKTKGMVWINNGSQNKLTNPQVIPLGWSKGRVSI